MYDKLRFKSLVRERVDEDGQQHSDVGLALLSMGALTDGVTVREMTAGYAAIANQGAYNQPLTFSKVVDNTGKTIIEIEPENDQVMSVENAWLMQELLQNGVRNGLAGSGRLSIPLARKPVPQTTTMTSGIWALRPISPPASGSAMTKREPHGQRRAGDHFRPGLEGDNELYH